MKFQEEIITTLIENTNKMQGLSEELKEALNFGTIDSFCAKTAQIESLLLDSYTKNKKLMIAECKEYGFYSSTRNYEQYVELFEVSNRYIYFRIPVLNNRYRYKSNTMFDDLVRYIFLSIIDMGIKIPQMKTHTIEFTHVWPTSQKDHVLDNDNYDTRGIINSIVHFVGASDSGLNSWHVHRTILSDDLEMGTYIKVINRTP